MNAGDVTTASYAGPDRRRGPQRRAEGDDPTGRIDSLLFAKLASAQSDAEARYLGSVASPRPGLADSSRVLVTSSLNAKAEGLAEAMAIISGGEVSEIRSRSQELVRERQTRERASIADARAALA